MIPTMPRSCVRALSWPVVWLLAGCGARSAQATTPLAALTGTWEVVHVAVDHRDQPHWLYFPEDPRLLGRSVSISASAISIDNNTRDCQNPSVTALPKAGLQEFISQRFARPPQEGTPTHPTLSDFELAMADAAVLPEQIGCSNGASEWNASWIVPVAPDHLLTNYDNSGFVLVLERRNAASPIKPSFACAKAQSAAEQAICTSAALAGYDRSVAAAYRRALSLAGEESADVRREQTHWLTTRNACGGDAGCLAKSMRERTDQLMQQ
ncbi:lysozyme inhibitor LprI family protein [Rhodanobacter umsongensis]|uniref:Lysozyme inhibitor LprI family protein n=1 Tax=Rhodanobacter umsongensis TaxID=633153 RepID=A0ABW0JQE9_9GAMM